MVPICNDSCFQLNKTIVDMTMNATGYGGFLAPLGTNQPCLSMSFTIGELVNDSLWDSHNEAFGYLKLDPAGSNSYPKSLQHSLKQEALRDIPPLYHSDQRYE